MISITSDEKQVHHGAHPPVVYLDHFALMDIAQEHLDAFATALLQREGTLALSMLNFYELSLVNDQTSKPVDDLILRVWPHVAFLDLNAEAVIAKEDRLLSGEVDLAPHLDNELLGFLLGHSPRSGTSLDVSGFLRFFRSPDSLESARRASQRPNPSLAVLRSAQRAYEADRQAQRRLKGLIEGDRTIPSTRSVLVEATRFMIKNNLQSRDSHHSNDFLHTVVPLVYADFVVLDGTWVECARQIRAKLDRAGLVRPSARVFRRVTNFVEAFRGKLA